MIRYSESNVQLLSIMLHAAIRGLNSLADLEILQIFNEKYFGSTIENRNPTLLEVLHFEEEILRQKIMWREKYETVISSWITPKLAKGKLKIYKSNQEQNIPKAIVSENNQIIKTDQPKNFPNDNKIENSAHENSIAKTIPVVPDEKHTVDGVKQNKPAVTEESKPSVTTTEENPPTLNTGENTNSTLAATKDEDSNQHDANKKDKNKSKRKPKP